MPRLNIDPALEICPPYEDQQWDYVRQAIIIANQGAQPMTPEEAVQHLKDAWARDRDIRVVAWNAQLEHDRVELEEQARQVQEEQEAQRIQHEREAEEQRREADKKKPKLNVIDPNRLIPRTIKPRPVQYALNKINMMEYVELDYFSPRGLGEAAARPNGSIDQDTLSFSTQADGSGSIRPLDAQKASKNIRKDEDLSWEEMLQAKNNMLEFIGDAKIWPTPNAEALAGFYVALEMHSRTNEPNGKQALLLYQSKARQEWHTALKRDEGFNIEVIREDLLRSHVETVDRQATEKLIEEVRKAAINPTIPC
ncbi:hypothetical protein DFH94DRAFT_281156 [Russula ochroleuca]|jgi:hypothetical protein|uniref:Uncharacterized protein n=1 Tax=Russula ochroleuca TaxID=152965 RepID=A0A9P5MNV1_9AGAM|nr:hypothetical protein DFH94DRAFT_281156 [Russula ochroleuca]